VLFQSDDGENIVDFDTRDQIEEIHRSLYFVTRDQLEKIIQEVMAAGISNENSDAKRFTHFQKARSIPKPVFNC